MSLSGIFQFLEVKFSIDLNRRVLVGYIFRYKNVSYFSKETYSPNVRKRTF